MNRFLIAILFVVLAVYPATALAADMMASTPLGAEGTIIVVAPSDPGGGSPGGGGGGSSGGGGGGATDEKRFTQIMASANQDGILWENVTAYSVDIKLELQLEKGTQVLNANGYPPSAITVTSLFEWEETTENQRLIGIVYDITPKGLTFEPEATLNIYYDDDDLIEKVDEKSLCICLFNETSLEWEYLECYLDTENNCLTTYISHLCKFAIIGSETNQTYSLDSLGINPAEIHSGDTVTVTVLVSNDGEVDGVYEAEFKINNEVKEIRDVALEAGETKEIAFTTIAGDAGTYTIDVGELQTQMVVLPLENVDALKPAAFVVSNISAFPELVSPDEAVTINVEVANTGDIEGNYLVVLAINGIEETTREMMIPAGQHNIATFEVRKHLAGTYLAKCEGVECQFTVKIPSIQSTPEIGKIAGVSDNTSKSPLKDVWGDNNNDLVSEDSFSVSDIIIGGVLAITSIVALFMIVRKRR